MTGIDVSDDLEHFLVKTVFGDFWFPGVDELDARRRYNAGSA